MKTPGVTVRDRPPCCVPLTTEVIGRLRQNAKLLRKGVGTHQEFADYVPNIFPRLMRLLSSLLLVTPAILGAQAVNTDSSGLALKGYDPVAFFTVQQPTLGDARFTASHEGATYRFASAANRDTFTREASKYAPQYGGYCAFGVAGGYKVRIDPTAFTVRGGKLYLNYDKGVQARWLKDVPGYLSKSEANWPGLRDKPRRDRVGS